MKPRNRVALSSDPFRVVRDTAWQRAVKERLAKMSDVDNNGESASDSKIMQPSADLPRDLKVKLGQDQFTFLKLKFFEIAVKVHIFEESCVTGLANQSQKCRRANSNQCSENHSELITGPLITDYFRCHAAGSVRPKKSATPSEVLAFGEEMLL